MEICHTSAIDAPVRLPHSEKGRLQALSNYKILDTVREQEYENLTALAAILCEAPYAAVSFVDHRRQWFKSSLGFVISEVPLSDSFCAHTVHGGCPLVVPDTRLDTRFAENVFVSNSPKIRFYAGAPITTSNGYAVGALCVLDVVPRTLQQDQVDALAMLAHLANTMLYARHTGKA